MSRIANNPITVPSGVDLSIVGRDFTASGRHGELRHRVHDQVNLVREGDVIKTSPVDGSRRAKALAGTTRMLIQNIITGVNQGFERKLEIEGVGYRAQMQGKDLHLLLGFSHPVIFKVPSGIVVDTPSQTEIVVRGADKQQVGQVAAEIHAWRPPEPYKGKGIRYVGERVVRKEAKKG